LDFGGALRLLRRAAGQPVDHFVGGPDPVAAVQKVVREHDFDESHHLDAPQETSKWLRRDLIRRVESMGLPVTAVASRKKTTMEAIEDSPSFAPASV
jgi:hypothetical protein